MTSTTIRDSEQAMSLSAGTSLSGHVLCSRYELQKVFGLPTYETLDGFGKTTTEWVIVFSGGSVATIYDWKRYELGAPELHELEEWHIGGRFGENADALVREAMIDAGILED